MWYPGADFRCQLEEEGFVFSYRCSAAFQTCLCSFTSQPFTWAEEHHLRTSGQGCEGAVGASHDCMCSSLNWCERGWEKEPGSDLGFGLRYGVRTGWQGLRTLDNQYSAIRLGGGVVLVWVFGLGFLFLASATHAFPHSSHASIVLRGKESN